MQRTASIWELKCTPPSFFTVKILLPMNVLLSNIITRSRPYPMYVVKPMLKTLTIYPNQKFTISSSSICIIIIQYIHTVYNVYKLQLERQFEQALKKSRGMVIHRMKPDGACLFRAVGQSTPTPSILLPLTLTEKKC